MSVYSDRAYRRCATCNGWRAVRNDGTIWQHMGPGEDGTWNPRCAGSGKKPADTKPDTLT